MAYSNGFKTVSIGHTYSNGFKTVSIGWNYTNGFKTVSIGGTYTNGFKTVTIGLCFLRLDNRYHRKIYTNGFSKTVGIDLYRRTQRPRFGKPLV